MPSDRLTPKDWLAQQPLQTGERLYLIISAASDADALKTLYLTEPTAQLLPIWGGTPYSTWQPVMPYVTELKPNSAFLPWIAETDALDWGWLAVSRAEPNDVFEHLRSLTQVKMPDGTEVKIQENRRKTLGRFNHLICNLILNHHPIPIQPHPLHQFPHLPLLPHFPPDLILPIHPLPFPHKPVTFLKHVIPILPHPIAQQLPLQLRVPHVQLQLKSPIRRVMQYQVNVVVENCRAGTEWQYSPFVREWIETVVGAFNDYQR